MDANEEIRRLLNEIRDGTVDVGSALGQLRDLPFLDIGHTKIDLHRSLRNGFPEVIYAEGKQPDQVAEIFSSMLDHSNILATRVQRKWQRSSRIAAPKHTITATVELFAISEKR